MAYGSFVEMVGTDFLLRGFGKLRFYADHLRDIHGLDVNGLFFRHFIGL